MNNLVLIHNNVEEPLLLKSAFKNSKVILYNNQSVDEIYSDEIFSDVENNITNLALVYHPTTKYHIPFFETNPISEFKIISQDLLNLIILITTKINNTLIIDLLACNINEPFFINQIKLIENSVNVKFRYSLDNTGNNYNWVLESDNIDVKDYYFNININKWNYNLYTIYISSSFSNNGPFYKVIYSALSPTPITERFYLNVDISGNPINPIYDENLQNISYQSGRVITWGNTFNGGNNNDVSNLLQSDIEFIHPSLQSFVAYKKFDNIEGTLIGWGVSNEFVNIPTDLISTKNIYSTGYAYASIINGEIVCWGNPESGGFFDNDKLGGILSSVDYIQSTSNAFAALGSDNQSIQGKVICWGDVSYGGNYSEVEENLNDVAAIYSNWYAFAVIKFNGSVFAWGDVSNGGDISTVSFNAPVEIIFSTDSAFAALTVFGNVITWGNPDYGGDSSDVSNLLQSDVKTVYSNNSAFAALKNDGSVITWGNPTNGGNSNDVSNLLQSDVKVIYSTSSAFAALKNDGSVITWGNNGGNSTDVSNLLQSGVKSIYGNEGAFAALKNDGSVVSWGAFIYNTNYSSVKDQLLSGVINIYSNGLSFVAQKDDGKLIDWGSIFYINFSLLSTFNFNSFKVEKVYSNFSSYAAIVIDYQPAPTNININPDKADAIITYDNYTEFTVNDVELVGTDFGGAGIDFLENQTDYSSGFIITTISPNSLYTGSFILKDTLNNFRSFNVDISFTTTSEPDPPPENVNLNIDISFITITYDSYDFSDPDLIELTDGLNGLDISFLDGETNYKQGFNIINLSPNTFYSGGFILKNTFFSLTSEKTDISFTTLSEPEIPVFDTINSEINNIAILDEEMMDQRKLLIINKNQIKNLLIDISNNINNAVFPIQIYWSNISNTETLIDNNVRLINEKINQISQKKKYVRNLINQLKIENLTEPIPVRDPKLKYYYDKFIRK
jgi:hypothetical protein